MVQVVVSHRPRDEIGHQHQDRCQSRRRMMSFVRAPKSRRPISLVRRSVEKAASPKQPQANAVKMAMPTNRPKIALLFVGLEFHFQSESEKYLRAAIDGTKACQVRSMAVRASCTCGRAPSPKHSPYSEDYRCRWSARLCSVTFKFEIRGHATIVTLCFPAMPGPS